VPSFPELYDILHGTNLDDLQFYLDVCCGHDVVLECGIGTGRIAIPLARSGTCVYGIDDSKEMLRLLRVKLGNEPPEVQRRVKLKCMDMRQARFDRQFTVVIVPYMTFNYLGSIDEQIDTLRSLHKCMKVGAHLYLELISMFPPWFHTDGIPRLVKSVEDSASGLTVDVIRLTDFNPATQVLIHYRHFRFTDSRGVLVREVRTILRNRFMFLGEATLLLNAAGFNVREVWGDRQRGPYRKDSEIMLIAAQAA
jgi:cyclopropane fatty-acyl-phospholipid synthase-like methyltransferase